DRYIVPMPKMGTCDQGHSQITLFDCGGCACNPGTDGTCTASGSLSSDAVCMNKESMIPQIPTQCMNIGMVTNASLTPMTGATCTVGASPGFTTTLACEIQATQLCGVARVCVPQLPPDGCVLSKSGFCPSDRPFAFPTTDDGGASCTCTCETCG